MQKRVTLLKGLVFLAVAAGGYWLWSQRAPERYPISGTIEVDEVHVASRYGGRIEALPHREGDILNAGDVIAELDAAELVARRDLAAAQLVELEHGPRENEIAAALRDWESLKAQVVFAQADAKRSVELLKGRAISSSEAEKTASTANALLKSADAAQHRYELLHEGTRPERVDQAKAQLAEIEAQIKEMRIAAPSHSILEVLSVKPGDVVAANREIATLILPDYLWMRVYVPAPWLAKIRLGQPVELRVDGLRDKVFHGTVEQINRVAEFTPRNVQTVDDRLRQVFGVKIRLDNSSQQLRAGMSGEVRFAGINEQPGGGGSGQ